MAGLLDYIKATGGLLGNAYDSAVNRTSGLLSDEANYKQSLAQMLDPKWQAEMRKPENMALFDKQSESLGNEMALTFAGPIAKTANLAKLKIAEQMKARGVPDPQILVDQQIVRGLLGNDTGKAMSIPAKTQYELAHELARRNAALPVEQGGLGLRANNTAMDRAKSMGFDTPAYHGTNADIHAFDPLKHGSSTEHASSNIPATWVSGRPEVANIFSAKDVKDAYPIARYGNRGGGLQSIVPYNYREQGNVLPLMIRRGENMQTMKAGEGQSLIFGEKGDDWRGAGEEFVKRYNELGAPDVLKIKGHPLSELEFRANQYLLKDPSNIRSRFAAFDPMRRDSSDLLAGVAPWTIPAGLAGLLGASMIPQDAMAADNEKTKTKRQ